MLGERKENNKKGMHKSIGKAQKSCQIFLAAIPLFAYLPGGLDSIGIIVLLTEAARGLRVRLWGKTATPGAGHTRYDHCQNRTWLEELAG